MGNLLTEKYIEQEWRLIQSAQRDARQFEPLYDRYYEQVFRFVYKRTADEVLCADICSQVFLKALQNLSKYKFKGVPFSAWLFRIASNAVAQYYRDASKHRIVSMDTTAAYDLIAEATEHGAEQRPDIQTLMATLDSLPEKDIELIELRFFDKRPFKEIAQILNITESNAKVRTYRILDRLKRRLSE